MAKIQKLLYATDLSAASRPAWGYARLLARTLRAELVALHVVPPVPIPLEGGFPPGLYQDLLTGARRDGEVGLAELVREAAGSGVRVVPRLEEGPPAPRILEVLRQVGADLLAVGTHGRTGLGRILLGSVADTLVRQAPCPVLTVPSRLGEAAVPASLGRILYATDFSPVARRAWPWAVALAEASGAELDLVHVAFLPVPDREAPAEILSAAARQLREQAEREAERFLETCPLPRDRVHCLIPQGLVGDQIVHVARDRRADLIVMGTHGWSGLVRWMLGSVAHQLVQVAPCPVLTVGPLEEATGPRPE